MNWIDFRKEKPKAEPDRQILILHNDGEYYVIYTKTNALPPKDLERITNWAEIEPPVINKLDYSITISPEDIRITKIRPDPDPFEEWWNRNCGRYQGPTPYATCKEAWGAAIKYAKENP